MPSEEVNHDGSDADVEDVLGGRKASRYEGWEDDKLEGIGSDGQEHRGAKVRSRRNGNGVIAHDGENPVVTILDAKR